MNTKSEVITLSKIQLNTGQIPGVPSNPRKVDKAKLQNLVNSIREDPEMLELRGLMVYPYKGNYVAIGGNMRLRALRQLGYTETPCMVIPKDTKPEKLKSYLLKDNASFGEWDWSDMLNDYTVDELQAVSIEIPDFTADGAPKPKKQGKRAGWHKGKDAHEPLCDMKERIEYHERVSYSFISFYKRTDEGFPLSEIKSDESNVRTFATEAAKIISKLIGLRIYEGWCLVTTPKRRHKERNFSTMVCKSVSRMLGITFYEDIAQAKTRQRINAQFELVKTFDEPNVIVFDDILTTGSTMNAMRAVLNDKNCIFIVGIDNA